MKTDSSRARNLPVFLIPPPPLGPLPARHPHFQKGIGEYNLTSIIVLQWKDGTFPYKTFEYSFNKLPLAARCYYCTIYKRYNLK